MPHDGYTFGVGSVGTHAQNQTLYKRPAYSSVNEYTHIALIAETPIALTVRKDLPANNFQEFVTYAKANHGKMQFGSAGPGSATHLGCVVLNSVLGIDPTTSYREPALPCRTCTAAASTTSARSSTRQSRISIPGRSRRWRS